MSSSKQKYISSEKQLLRDKVRAMRRALDSNEVKNRSEIICNQILAMAEYEASRSIAVYLAFDNEVDLRSLIDDSFGKRRVFCPRIVNKKTVEFREIASWGDLTPNKLGILEPTTDHPLTHPQDIGLILIPGIAFDRKGHRLGLGAGYYDRFLKNTNGLRWGIGYDFQIVDQVPIEKHDQPLHRIISENL